MAKWEWLKITHKDKDGKEHKQNYAVRTDEIDNIMGFQLLAAAKKGKEITITK